MKTDMHMAYALLAQAGVDVRAIQAAETRPDAVVAVLDQIRALPAEVGPDHPLRLALWSLAHGITAAGVIAAGGDALLVTQNAVAGYAQAKAEGARA